MTIRPKNLTMFAKAFALLCCAGFLLTHQAHAYDPNMDETDAHPHKNRAEMRKKLRDRVEKRVIDQLDANKDGVISREEFLSRADERFRRLDTNKDGRLSREEIQAERRQLPLPSSPSEQDLPPR